MNDQPRIRPALRPDEQWRASLKDAVIAAAAPQHEPATPHAGTRDFSDAPLDHVAHVYTPELGVTVTVCDLEPVDPDTVREAARAATNIVTRVRSWHTR